MSNDTFTPEAFNPILNRTMLDINKNTSTNPTRVEKKDGTTTNIWENEKGEIIKQELVNRTGKPISTVYNKGDEALVLFYNDDSSICERNYIKFFDNDTKKDLYKRDYAQVSYSDTDNNGTVDSARAGSFSASYNSKEFPSKYKGTGGIEYKDKNEDGSFETSTSEKSGYKFWNPETKQYEKSFFKNVWAKLTH